MAEIAHTIADVDARHVHIASAPGSLRVHLAPVVVGSFTRVTIGKYNATNNEFIVMGTFLLSAADWTTLKARNPTLALAAIAGTNP